MKYQNRHHSFEQQELDSKRQEYQFLERRLVKLQYDLDDLREEIAEFEKIYAEQMSERISELESLEKEIDKLSEPGEDPRSGFRAHSFEKETRRMSSEEFASERAPALDRLRPNESLKEVYRKVAKAIHPDLSPHEGERKRRQILMAEANRAYAEEDHATLLTILQEWDVEFDPLRERKSERIVLYQRTASLKERIRALETEIFRLKGSDVYRLVQQVQQARSMGKDVLGQMAAKLEVDILAACRRLNKAKQSRYHGSPPVSAIRTVTFLPDRSVGQVYVRNSLSRNFLDWRKLGQAIGNMAVPSGTSLRLDVDKGRVADLDLLTGLSANDLHGCYLYGVNNADLAHVLRFRGLEELYISGAGITSEGLIHLLELSSVERLYLYDTLIGDEGIVYLKYLKRLRYVTFCNSRVSEAGMKRLKTTLDSCTVINLPTGRQSHSAT